MFIPSTFKRPVSSWKALNLRKTLLMASSVRLKPLNCSRLPCVYAQETLTFLLTQKKTCVMNIYNNYFKAPWMPDRTEANPNELNQDDARYGFRCCHLKNIWTAPLPPETELSRQMTTSTTSIDIMGLQAAYANLHTDQERDYFMQRY